MIKIEQGEIYRAARARSGVGERGPWELVAVADENNEKRTVTLFVENTPSGIRENGQFKVTDILSVKVGYKKDGAGQWKNETTFTVNVEAIKSDIEGFDEVGGETPWGSDDWELPL